MNEKCFVCFANACCYRPSKKNRFIDIDCSRCGAFTASQAFWDSLIKKKLTKKQIATLSGYLREAKLFHQEIILNESILNAPNNNFEKWLSQLNKTTTEKQNKLLIALEKLMPEPGETIIISLDTDISLAWAASENELKFYLEALHEQEYIHFESCASPRITSLTQVNSEIPDDYYHCKIKILYKGWKRLEEIATDFSSNAQVFVAMKIVDPILDDVYKNHIREAIKIAGYKPYRIDQDHENTEKLDNKIIKEIKNSRFLLADVTGQRQSVYYEAGYAQGLGIPVIWSVNKTEMEKVHFDTRQYPHQTWEDGEHLEKILEHAILAQIGRGPIIHDA